MSSKPEIYASLDPAARGSSFQIAVVMKIRPGFHVNAREKSEDYLIATDLKSELRPASKREKLPTQKANSRNSRLAKSR